MMLREKFELRTNEKEICEKYLNLEKHQNADGFPLKDIEIFSKNFIKLRKINKINKKLDIFELLI